MKIHVLVVVSEMNEKVCFLGRQIFKKAAGFKTRRDLMHNRFFHYQIYRRRFTFAVVLVLFFSFLLLSGMIMFFAKGWLLSQQEEAQKAFEDIVERVQKEKESIEDYAWSLYSSVAMMDDAQAYFTAKDEQDYLNQRRNNSLRTSAQIESFTEYLRGLFSRSNSFVNSATVLSSSSVDKIVYVDSYGTLRSSYGNFSRTPQIASDDWMIHQFQVRAAGSLNSTLGKVCCWVKGDEVFQTQHPYIGQYAVVDSTDRLWGIRKDSNARQITWLKTAAKQTDDSGGFFDGTDYVFFTRYEEPLHRFSYISTVSIGALMAENNHLIWLMVLAIFLLDILVIGFIYWNVHYDSYFLGYMLGIIEKVEKGDFKGVKQMKRPKFRGKDEYGMISEALESMSNELDERILMEYRMQLQQKEADMRAMQHQINPHFLYNTLEAIRAKALAEKNPQTADAIALLGDLYRDMIRKEGVLFFSEEKELLESYLQIMQLRYPDSFGYQIMFDQELLEQKTPKFWLQPLAENFFSHGFDRRSEYNVLVVSGMAEGSGWRIEMIDNGSGIPINQVEEINVRMRTGDDSPGSSIGLRNVYSRLSYFYGKEFTMELRNNTEGGVCVSIYIPQKEASDVYPVDC